MTISVRFVPLRPAEPVEGQDERLLAFARALLYRHRLGARR
jgi:hypothetical protein